MRRRPDPSYPRDVFTNVIQCIIFGGFVSASAAGGTDDEVSARGGPGCALLAVTLRSSAPFPDLPSCLVQLRTQTASTELTLPITRMRRQTTYAQTYLKKKG
jgi:hypothetical protein